MIRNTEIKKERLTPHPSILILGAGNIGTAIAFLLSSVNYDVVLADQTFKNPIDKKIQTLQCDINDTNAFDDLLKRHKFNAIISSLPYFCNIKIAQKAREYGSHYFDLTEDVKTTEAIIKIAKDAHTVFIPQCGLAPGFINIAAHDLMQNYDALDSVCLRAGALPQHSSNALHYALTWSTDGLINEYGNQCEAIVDGQYVLVKPLENVEEIILDGVVYEAFNTSGGLSTLWKKYLGKVNTMNYKTLRYPGHCEKIKLLMNDFHLNQHRDMLKILLEESIPKSQQDMVILHISVVGIKNKEKLERTYTKTLYPTTVNNYSLTAIQAATASGICALVDIILMKKHDLKGFINQEQFSFSEVLSNRFGQYYG